MQVFHFTSRSVLPRFTLNIPQCRHFVTGPYIYIYIRYDIWRFDGVKMAVLIDRPIGG